MPNVVIDVPTQIPARPSALLELRKPTVPAGVKAMPAGGGATAYVEWRFPKRLAWDRLEIIQLTDVQYGSQFCDVEKLDQYLDWILGAPNRYAVLGGDMVEAYNYLKSPGTPYEQMADPLSCLGGFLHKFMPVAHRFLGYVSGNHERRHMALGDLTRLLAEVLGVPWTVGRQHIAVYFGEHKPFKISMHHGTGSARTRGSIVNALERMAKQDDSDLFLMGHLHRPNAFQITRSTWDVRNRCMALHDQWAAMGSSFLKHWGSYADTAGYDPGRVSMPLAVLDRGGSWNLSLRG